jgi:hypothetical protein
LDTSGPGARYGRGVRAELRSSHAPETSDGTLEALTPEAPENFALHVQALVGPSDGPGEESFEFRVCSPSWFANATHRPKGYESPRHTILLERWDPTVVTRAISDLCQRTEGATWHDVGTSLSRFGRWEFEDYAG